MKRNYIFTLAQHPQCRYFNIAFPERFEIVRNSFKDDTAVVKASPLVQDLDVMRVLNLFLDDENSYRFETLGNICFRYLRLVVKDKKTRKP